MAYDAAKAHEYYLKYKKKGLKKGRKKGAKKAKQQNLVGLSTGGLNDQGKMQWAMTKDKLKSEMNAALAKAKTPEEKDKIRAEYQNKALAELTKMKGDTSLAQAKKAKAASTKSASSKGSSAKSGSSKSSAKSSSSGSSKSSASTQKAIQQIKDSINQLQSKLSSLTDDQKAQVKETIQVQIDAIRERLKKNIKGISLK